MSEYYSKGQMDAIGGLIGGRIKAAIAALGWGGVAVAQYRASTVTNMNASTAGQTVLWDDTALRREDNGISIGAASEVVTVAGTPDHIVIGVNIHIWLPDSSSGQRPNQRVELERSDGLILAAAATGYIRDSSDHEESSYNFTVTDANPIADGTYKIVSYRETTNAIGINLHVQKSQLDFRAYY